MSDQRHAPRQRTFKGGTISLAGGSLDCTIRNLSDTGAMLELPEPVITPDTFILIIKPELLTRCCEVAWRIGSRVGVRFQSTPELALNCEKADLEISNTALRSLVPRQGG